MNKKFYVTTAIDYANDVIHIGHAYQKIVADVLARYHRQLGEKTFFLTGTDEHGQKVEHAAEKEGVKPKEFTDRIAQADKEEWKSLKISYDRFIRTTDPDHIKLAQEFYLKSKAKGDIYLGKYEGLYCEGCEAYLTESDLVDGKCPLHPNRQPQKIVEENYFFALSKYQQFLEKYLEENPDFIQPESKRKEILAFIKDGLKDFSVSRQSVRWGIPVPDDPQQTLYVWFDALINYVSGAPDFWPADVHILGKDNQRFHAIYWPAMLNSADYKLPKTILVHDFIFLNGQKISKSLGNVIKPSELVKQFGTDGTRYFFIKNGPLNNDIDINLDKIKETYNADLANGLGNLVSRIAKLCEKSEIEFPESKPTILAEISECLDKLRPDLALEKIWQEVATLDKEINNKKPWEQNNKELKQTLVYLVNKLRAIAYNLKPFLPETGDKIEKQYKGSKIKSEKPLFPRIS